MDRRNFLITTGAVAAAAATGSLDARADIPARRPLAAVRGSLVAQQELTTDQKRLIVDVGINLVEQVYVHRTMKMAQYGIDVVPQLRALRARVSDMKDLAFHREMRRIFVQLRDRHTFYISGEHKETYILGVTTLRAFDNGEWKYFITRSDDHSMIPIGSQVVSWNGVHPEQVVEEFAENVGAGNLSSRLAVARRDLTKRLTSKYDLPFENEVRLGIIDPAGKNKEALLKWHIQQVQRKLEVPTEHIHELGIDEPHYVTTESDTDADWVSSKKITFGGRDFGLLHIKTFHVPDNYISTYMEHVLEKLKPLPPTGLVIDIRHNGGGYIVPGETMLQLFTSKPIEPHTFRLRASETMAAATDRHRLRTWKPTTVQGVAFGSEFSADFPLTSRCDSQHDGRRGANCIQWVYPGPVILLVDSITYSTADMFASGFQSNAIGKIIGVDDNIGAGGANNFKSLADLRQLLPHNDPRFPPLPNGVDFSVAVRQAIRKGPYSGMILEDEGIKVDYQYKLTKRDVLPQSKDRDLLEYACGLLRA